ncbi:hypothetical protein LCGC14_0258650 [marine sediment metagenome]|uniref:Uncharacterized protein n=1 Tax=marine sediment metagenome TaxID=412755 RepID=A0A0F9U2E7_9ZZZZ
MAISNPSFETAKVQSGVDVESLPADWTKSCAAVGYDAATFGPPFEWVETFEALWSSNEDALDAFVGVGTDLTEADFGTSPLQTVYDSFEQLWPDNEDAITEFESGNLTAGVFGSAAAEFDSFGIEWPARHPVADVVRFVTATVIDATPANVYARLNELKADFNLHGADATVHTSADVMNVIAAADASDLSSAVALATELWDDIWPHITDGALAWHLADTAGSLSAPSDGGFYLPTTFQHCADIANALTYSLDLHFTWADASGYGYFVEYDLTFANVFAYPFGAVFGTSSDHEGFEENWQNNQAAISAFVGVGTDLTAGDFTTDGAPNSYESFETELTLQVIGAPAFGTPLDINPGSGVRVTVSGTFSATLILQVQRPGRTAWIDWDTATAAGDIDVDEGYSSVRMYTQAYVSGTPAAKLKWRPIETL